MNKTGSAQHIAAGLYPSQPAFRSRAAANLSITVLFTTTPATLAALKKAGDLALELGAQIRILVAQVVPYPLALDNPPIEPGFNTRHLVTRASNESIVTRIEVLLCRDPLQAVAQELSPQSLVLLGGPKHWWPTRERRFARELQGLGHHVIFVPES